MGYKATAVAQKNAAQKAMLIGDVGRLAVILTVKDALDVVASYVKKQTGKNFLAHGDVKVQGESVFDGDSLAHTPVAPGSLVLSATGVPTLVDSDRDGLLYLNRTTGAQLAQGTDGVTSVPATKQLTSALAGFVAAGVVSGDLLVILKGPDAGQYVITTVAATTLGVSTSFPVGSQTTLDYAIYAQKIAAGNINYFSGKLKLVYPASASPAARGSVVGTVSFPISLNPGETLTVDVDAAGPVTATFTAARAALAGSGGTFAAMNNETMNVQFENDEVQPIVFGTEASLQDAADTINTQLLRGEAVINAGQIDIKSDFQGSSSRVRTTSVAAGITTKLGIPNNGDATGVSGSNVANIKAVAYSEMRTVVQAAVTACTATQEETGKPRLSSNTVNTGANSKIQIGGTARTKFGFDALLHTGADAGPQVPVTANYVHAQLVAAGSAVTQMLNNSHGEFEIWLAGKDKSGKVEVSVVSP